MVLRACQAWLELWKAARVGINAGAKWISSAKVPIREIITCFQIVYEETLKYGPCQAQIK